MNEPSLSPEIWYNAGRAHLFAAQGGVASGPLVVMLHGGMADHVTALPLVRHLTARYRVVTPDQRGSGRSHSTKLSGFDRLADDVAALMDHLGVERAVVGGVSAGSGVAVRFALRYPKRVSALILVRPMYAGADRGYSQAQHEAFAQVDAMARRAPDEGLSVLEPMYARLPEEIRAKALAMLRGFDPKSLAATSRFLSSGVQPFRTASELRKIAVPVLLVRGDDTMHPSAVSEEYANVLREVEVLPASADPSDAIRAFCERVRCD